LSDQNGDIELARISFPQTILYAQYRVQSLCRNMFYIYIFQQQEVRNNF